MKKIKLEGFWLWAIILISVPSILGMFAIKIGLTNGVVFPNVYTRRDNAIHAIDLGFDVFTKSYLIIFFIIGLYLLIKKVKKIFGQKIE